MLIAAYALQVRHAFVYIRGEFDLPYRRIAGAVDEAYAAGLLGAPIAGRRVRVRHRRLPRRRLVRLR
jgi:NADH-quinone oxidoreductase subunit F